MMALAGVDVGLVRYLCLKNTVTEIFVACVVCISIFQHLYCSGDVPSTQAFVVCSAHVFLLCGLSSTSVSMPMGTKGCAE